MRLSIYRILFIFILVCLCRTELFATGGGSRASFTRGGWVGARYVAMGMAADVLADDIYAIYWNPAGLYELKGKKKLTADEIKKKARTGDIEDIREEDLLDFSEQDVDKSFVQLGISGAMLDVSRNAAFTGVAFDMLGGVFGVGLYSIASFGIESRDDSGAYIEDINYIASVSYISYSWSMGIATIGASLKGLYEKIGNVNYMGFGTDVGTQIYVLPFLKVGFVAQDLGTGLFPVGNQDNIENRYDLASPTLKLGLTVTSDTGITFAISAIKKLEQDKFNIGAGIQYDIKKLMSIYLGMNNSYFSTGLTLKLSRFNISYAFTIDRIDYGYNNIVSISVLF